MEITKSGFDEGNQAYEFDIDGKKEIRTRESLIEDREGFEIILDNRQMTADQRRQIGVALDRINDQISLIDEMGDE